MVDAELERLEHPEGGIDVRWQRVTERGWPAVYLDVGSAGVAIWEQANPRDQYGQHCSSAEFVQGALHDLICEVIGEDALREALEWLGHPRDR